MKSSGFGLRPAASHSLIFKLRGSPRGFKRLAEPKDGCVSAQSPGNYKAQVNATSSAYSWPAAIPPSTPFHPLFSGVNIRFYKSNGTTSLTLHEVLSVVGAPDSQQVAFHIVAAYLNVNGGNGAVIPPHVIDSAGVKKLWNEWDLKGYYEPFAGVKWYATEIKNYLISNGIVK